MIKRLAVALPAVAVAALAVATPAAWATNGMYLTAYGAETLGRGGANLAISDRTLAINFNPAGISQLQGNHMSLGVTVLAPSLTFENLANGETDAQDRYFPLPSVAYVRGSKESRWSWGLGFIAQGGLGATFDELNTFFGTRDETFTEVRFFSVVPTVAYAISDDMALGMAVNVGYSDVSFRFFPDTSFFNVQDPSMSFFGVNMKQAGGLQYNVRAGWWWRPSPRLSVGAVYQTETQSDFEDGDTWVDFRSLFGQKVTYTSDVEGFTYAAQAGVGFALRPDDRWTWALDIKRYFWDDAIDVITVTARDPSLGVAPPQLVFPFVFNWKDQWVLAVGADYRVNDRLTVRGGYNYGENPVPDETLTPLFPATVEHHLAAGFSYLKGKYTYELAVEHAFDSQQTNNNVDPMVNPFGPGSTVSHEQWSVGFSVSWAWARAGR